MQEHLTRYLQHELYHLLGAYGIAASGMSALAEELAAAAEVADARAGEEREEARATGDGQRLLSELASCSGAYNADLARHRHASTRTRTNNHQWVKPPERDAPPVRDPIPDDLPLTSPLRFEVRLSTAQAEEARKHVWEHASDWLTVAEFYGQSLHQLERYKPTSRPPAKRDDSRDRDGYLFAQSLLARRDGTHSAPSRDKDKKKFIENRRLQRIARYTVRLQEAIENLPPHDQGKADRRNLEETHRRKPPRPTPATFVEMADQEGGEQTFLTRITLANLSDRYNTLPIFVVRALAEAHLSMHAVEAWQKMCLAEETDELRPNRREWLDEELKRCIALGTFAYCASRTAPWMFATDKDEAESIFEHSEYAWETVVPARAMWTASQVSLLALHRRAYARALQGDTNRAYNDYHKLHRHLRDTQRRVRAAPTHVEGALEFCEALEALSHHHIGELYRGEHAHNQARKHLSAASHRLDSLRKDKEMGDAPTSAASHRLGSLRKDKEMGDVLTSSRWYVELQVSHGKTSYEMGRHKEALCWYLRGWSAFLKLLAADTGTHANTQAAETAIKWLERVVYEPELSKSEVREHVCPVIEQLDRVSISRRYWALAGEILLRLGHLLFILNLGDELPPKAKNLQQQTGAPLSKALAAACLAAAFRYDKNNTLLAADRLKALLRYEIKREAQPGFKKPNLNRVDALGDEPLSVAKSWPGGMNDYERISRSAEYLLLTAQLAWEPPEGNSVAASDLRIARELLLNFFMSTDSINVRKSQVHRLLMRKPAGVDPPANTKKPAIEFVCMRRYSSPFPLLPRPSAFRSLGGGYFLRLYAGESGEGAKHFGIAIDPGFHFIENLYRTGHSLNDIDMIIVTHDHVDHAGGLDALISLWHVRSRVLRGEGDVEKNKPLMILASESVDIRYQKTKLYQSTPKNKKGETNEFWFMRLEGIMGNASDGAHRKLLKGIGFPSEFEIVPLSTAVGKGEGHKDLSDKPALGICVKARDGGPSVAIAGDAPKPPREGSRNHAAWTQAWREALESDVLMVHLSSVPLTELRRYADPRSQGGELHASGPAQAHIDSLETGVRELDEIRQKLEGADPDGRLKGQIEYGHWLRSKELPKAANIAGKVDKKWMAPVEHAFLLGTLNWARTYKEMRVKHGGGLFLVGELSEEMGSMRGRIAANINKHIYASGGGGAGERAMSALTGDIGLRVFVTGSEPGGTVERPQQAKSQERHTHKNVAMESAGKETQTEASDVQVLCTSCNLDTDRVRSERYHLPCHITETCVKGENEGIFYNCDEHAPDQQSDPVFLEELERFDVFGR